MSSVIFDVKKEGEQLTHCAETVLRLAKAKGATAAAVDMSSGAGYSLSVRLGEVETVEYGRDQSVSILVYQGQRKGSASTTDLSMASLEESVTAALAIAQATGEDPDAGLPEKADLATELTDLSLYHPSDMGVDAAIEIARACEQFGLDYDPRIHNSEGASFSTNRAVQVYANSLGFIGLTPGTSHQLSCSLLAEVDGDMQRDYAYHSARAYEDLWSGESIAKRAAQRTLSRLGAKRIPTCEVPVLFMADVAKGLWGGLMGAISGAALYRRASFLLDHLGQAIFPEKVNIYQRPHVLKGAASTAFDGEGVATVDRHFVRDGVLESYVLGSYSARKLGLKTTGNAGGVFNLRVDSDALSFQDLLKTMNKGLVVIELMGQGVNMITGDYSRGAMGLWVDNGEIQFPVHEITIAGNMKKMFQDIVAIGNDVDQRGNVHTGSVLIEKMMIAGS